MRPVARARPTGARARADARALPALEPVPVVPRRQVKEGTGVAGLGIGARAAALGWARPDVTLAVDLAVHDRKPRSEAVEVCATATAIVSHTGTMTFLLSGLAAES